MEATRPAWGVEATKKLIDLGVSKKALAKMLAINYRQLCNVISGYVNSATIQARIENKINELEKGA